MGNDEVINRRADLAEAIAFARTQSPVGSPCIDVCRLNPSSGLCEGCLRSRDEIKAWKALNDPDRLALLATLMRRVDEGIE